MSNATRLAIVGYGLIGKRHAKAISGHANIELAAVVDPLPSVQAEAIGLGASWYSSLDDLFGAQQIDGVVLATPTPLHASQALCCIENGCPLLVEKPIAVTSKEGAKVVVAAAKADVPILVGHHRRYNGIVRAARQAIIQGDIGEIRAMNANCWFYKPDTYFEEAPWRKQKGAGPISVNLTHDIDLLRYFCGDVEHVQAQAKLSRRGCENEDVAAALLQFRSGAIATITVSDSIVSPWSWEMTSNENPIYPNTSESCYLIGGSEGSISIPDMRIWKHENSPDWWQPISTDFLPVEHRDPLHDQISHFSNVISRQSPPIVSGFEGLKTLQVIEAIQNAAMCGETIQIPCNDKVLETAA